MGGEGMLCFVLSSCVLDLSFGSFFHFLFRVELFENELGMAGFVRMVVGDRGWWMQRVSLGIFLCVL